MAGWRGSRQRDGGAGHAGAAASERVGRPLRRGRRAAAGAMAAGAAVRAGGARVGIFPRLTSGGVVAEATTAPSSAAAGRSYGAQSTNQESKLRMHLAIPVVLTFLPPYLPGHDRALLPNRPVLLAPCPLSSSQYFIIITRLNLNWPRVIHKLAAGFGTLTGASNFVTFAPSCFFPEYASSGQARVTVFYSLAVPCLSVLLCLALWALR